MLPPAPAFVRPVHVGHRIGDDELVVAGRERAGRARANDTIVCFAAWYADLVATYGRTKAETKASDTAMRCAALEADAIAQDRK